ncbi:hypothetical protein J1N35_027036 [Gossypium stocksii]|uniref:Uncharacterized protein n=1 Tax=Gossypium stocksii TaxID=47602 RepID=A0A9D3VAP8_9ROSI|nr:hypothetical protein J1N35_027036 [Gossypium stocksii]
MDDGTLIPKIEYTLDPDRNTVGRISSELKLPEKSGVTDYSTRFICQVGVFVVADALFIGAQQVGRYLQDIRSH